MDYDVAIIGGGPAGLTLATFLPGKIALFERHPVLGGCHRYDSVSYAKFVEHGPRVYSGSYVNCKSVLKHIGVDWDSHFEPLYFSPEYVDQKHWYTWLSAKEIAWLTFEYIMFVFFDKDHGKSISVKAYCSQKRFSLRSTEYLDLVCRFSDGAGADRYTLWEFLSGFDQHTSSFYVPKRPNDELFNTWEEFLKKRRVRVFTKTNVTHVASGIVTIGSQKVTAKKIILCIPPVHAEKLLRTSGILLPEFRALARKSKYDTYWSVTFFGATWPASQKSTPWGIIAVQYPFGVVSAAASRFDAPGSTGKTIPEMSDEEIAVEIRHQLGLGSSPYAYATGKYNDQSFVFVEGHVPYALAPGIETVGCHNGKSSYNFTSMESAVQNALVYAGMPVQKAWYAGDTLRALFWIIVIVAIVKIKSNLVV